MILTGEKIREEVERKRIIIQPFDPCNLEPNSYGFHLGKEFLVYEDEVLDVKKCNKCRAFDTPESGFVLLPNRLYLSKTFEVLGSDYYAQTLHCRRSVSTMGMWIHFSAPLGHTGAIIPWTLEILVSHPLIVYPYMPVGKIAFWENKGKIIDYSGRYLNSETVIASKIHDDRHPGSQFEENLYAATVVEKERKQ